MKKEGVADLCTVWSSIAEVVKTTAIKNKFLRCRYEFFKTQWKQLILYYSLLH